MHEVRDALHVFVRYDEDEKRVIESAPFQRLRYVHQLALSFLVYPGATHRRFEHSLGVMELAGRIYDVVTRDDGKMSDAARELLPNDRERAYWRATLRMAALCHDTGHLPFSHAAEERLLPDGWDHERITWEIIHCPIMGAVWSTMRPKPDPDDVGKLALGPRKVEKLKLGLSFTPWEAILAEIIVGDVFGADRIDYLLRDSLHTGVAYGRFDHHRLIDTLRILPRPPQERGESAGAEEGEGELTLGCERGGLESAEALLLARYFMFAQVYYHPTRLIYDQHLVDFLSAWLPRGRFATTIDGHLARGDNEVLSAIAAAAAKPSAKGHDAARRIVKREHFRVVYQRRPEDTGGATEAIARATAEKFDAGLVRYAASPRRGEPPDFPVRDRDGRSVSSLSSSDVLARLPASRDEYVFVDEPLRVRAKNWIKHERESILQTALTETDDKQEGVSK
ncbi:MAG: HD domain-containing protein [Solirubrobacterales bacterium]